MEARHQSSAGVGTNTEERLECPSHEASFRKIHVENEDLWSSRLVKFKRERFAASAYHGCKEVAEAITTPDVLAGG